MWQRFKGFFSREDEEPQRAKPKPRQDWLVAVGQGHSPARTLRRESRGGSSKPRRKKFDTARLSFGGLEQEQEPRRPQSPLPADDSTDTRQPRSPPATPSPRPRRNRPDFSPSSAASSRASSRASPRRHPAAAAAASPRSPAGDDSAGGGRRGSPSRRSPGHAPASPPQEDQNQKTDWLSAAVSGRGSNRSSSSSRSSGGGVGEENDAADALAVASAGAEDDGGGGGSGSPVDAKLNSLLVLSPGKEYWAGRLAAKGPRDSTESPRMTTARRKTGAAGGKSRPRAAGAAGAAADNTTDLCSPREVSPLKYPARKERNKTLRHAAGRPQQLQLQQEESRGNGAFSVSPRGAAGGKKEFSSFTAGRKGPAPLSPGYGGGGGGASSAWPARASARGSPGGRERVDISPWRALQKGEVWSPSSSSRQQVPPSTASWSPAKGPRRRDFSPASTRVAREGTLAPAAPVVVAAAAAAASASGGAAYHSAKRQTGGGASLSLSPAGVGPSFRGGTSATFSPRKESVGAGFVGGSRSGSPLQRQARDPLVARPGPQGGGYSGSRGRPLARERVTSPSSLPAGGLFKGFGRSGGGGGGSSGRDSGSPEHTAKAPGGKRDDSPERTGEAASASSDDDAGSAGAVKKRQEPAGPDASGGEAEARLAVEDTEKKGEEGTVKSKRSRRKEAEAAKQGGEGMALALPPATEKDFIGFLPEEFCAPFRLLFQLFAVAGWP